MKAILLKEDIEYVQEYKNTKGCIFGIERIDSNCFFKIKVICEMIAFKLFGQIKNEGVRGISQWFYTCAD